VSDVLNLSAADNLIIPSIPISLTIVLSENQTQQLILLQPRSREVRAACDLSTSENLIASLVPSRFAVLRENEISNTCYHGELVQ
jgi:hypothetical protein